MGQGQTRDRDSASDRYGKDRETKITLETVLPTFQQSSGIKWDRDKAKTPWTRDRDSASDRYGKDRGN